jgi:glucose/mannose transport system permease protein
MFIPYQGILIPLIQFLQQVKLYGTIYGLITVHVLYGLPITSLIFRNYFANIPDELMEAARIDGAGIIRTDTNVMLPLSLPGFVVVGIFQFTNIWNDFLFGVTILPKPTAQPVTGRLEQSLGVIFGRLECGDGRSSGGGVADRSGLHLSWSLLRAGPVGGFSEGLVVAKLP